MTPQQLLLALATVIVTQAMSALYQTHHFDKRIEDLREFVRSEIKRLEDRLSHLEHPVFRG
ncbi:MAG TPA: hypothetical protein VMT20_08575 [Terriglobia bacterium]|nr:hypothetical protein [Terriglobia bacterium]